VIAVAAIAGTLLGIILSYDWTEVNAPATVETTAQQLGEMLLSEYVLPFEITSVVLIVALVGAVMIARRDNKQIRMK
jgi:NADH:ubiquinone oxidoreductase subunit 6 (subunit J)